MTRHDSERPLTILGLIAEASYPPTVRELMRSAGLRSTAAVQHHVEALISDGLVERSSGHSRSLRATPAGLHVLGIERCAACNGTGRVA